MSRPQAASENHHFPPEKRGEYTLSADVPAALSHIASIAPNLKEAELRVLLYLTADAIDKRGSDTRRSSREIASATKSARRAVQKALDSLRERGIIANREGDGTKAAAYVLPFLELTTISGAFGTPPPERSGAIGTPPLALFERHPGATGTPPHVENKRPTTALDINPDSIETLDRALTAKAEDFQRGELAEVARVIAWTHQKLHARTQGAPDAKMCAEILAACDGKLEAVHWLVTEIASQRREPGGGAWWVSVALQRIHGINAKDTATRRAEWKHTRRPRLVERDIVNAADTSAAANTPPPPPYEDAADSEAAHDWTPQIAALAATKRL